MQICMQYKRLSFYYCHTVPLHEFMTRSHEYIPIKRDFRRCTNFMIKCRAVLWAVGDSEAVRSAQREHLTKYLNFFFYLPNRFL